MTIPSGYAQANLKFGHLAAPSGAEVTLGLDISGFSGDPSDLAEAVYNSFQARVLPWLSAAIELRGCLVKFGPDATGPSGLYTEVAAGGDTDPGASAAVAYLVQKVTGSGGRAGRGRMYVPGVAEGAVTASGTVASGKLTALQDGFDDFHDDLSAGPFGPVVLHGPASPLSTPTPITSFVVSGTVATQRQRQRR